MSNLHRGQRHSINSPDPGVSRRVLHVAQPAEGGVARYIDAVVAAHCAQGWTVAVASTFAGGRRATLEGSGVKTFDWRARRSPIRGVRSETRALREIVADYQPDVVVLHAAKAGLIGRLLLRGALPTVVMPHAWSFSALHGPMAQLCVAWERVATRWTHAVVAVSNGEVLEGLSHKVLAPYFVIPNPVMPGWIATTEEERRKARMALGWGNEPLVVCVGRLSRQKGQDLLLQAWPAVRAQLGTARLALVGDGPMAGELRAAASGDVHFAGWVDEPHQWVAAADVVVFPSRWEGLSLAMLEAMAAGRCVVTSAVNGSELISACNGGAVVPVGAVAELSRALTERLVDRHRSDVEGARAADYVGTHHRLDVAVEELAAVLTRAGAFGPTVAAPAA